MTSKPAATEPPSAPGLDDRVERLRLQLVCATVLRMPVALPVFNLFTAWLLWRTGWQVLAPLWFLAMTGLHGWRWQVVRRWKRQPPADAQQANRWLATLVLGLAALLALATALVFAGPQGPSTLRSPPSAWAWPRGRWWPPAGSRGCSLCGAAWSAARWWWAG